MQRTILYSLILIAGLLLGIGLLRYYPYVASMVSFDRRFTIISLEGSTAGKLELSRTENPKSIFLLVADRRMDRRWNTTHLETRLGLKISQILNERSIDSAVFDRKDAGLPPDHYLPTTEIAEQIRDAFIALQAYRESQQIYRQNQVTVNILAHGDGCLATLTAIAKFQIEPTRMILLGCAYDGSLLETYGETIRNTMQLTKVKETILTQSQSEWHDWLNQPEYEELTEDQWLEKQKVMLKEGIDQDLVAFRRTVSVFQRPHNRKWLIESKQLSYIDLVNQVLKSSRVLIDHYPSEFDEELPTDLITRNSVRAATFGPRYTFKVLPRTDHFLFEKDTPPASPVENMMSRGNPFKSLSSAFLAIIDTLELKEP